jgi:hypothetical protein
VTRSARLFPGAGFVLALVGLVLLVLAVVRTLNGTALGTIGAVLLWVGVGLIAVAIVLLTLSTLLVRDESAPSAGSAGGGQPADG